ncbi:MAG: polyprenyl synthetase family protein [Victivallales bacterium]|nr:polyprenyl synthetase family protein [Victivallales bacterium]
MNNEQYLAAVVAIADATYELIWRYLKEDKCLFEPHLREVGGSYLEHRGKCLRPALLTFCCEAVGGSAELARPAAAAVEMFHTWTLMHDDVIDHDDVRRGRPTAHVRGTSLGQGDLRLDAVAAREYGVDLAILGGDYIHGAAMDMLLSLDTSSDLTLALARRMCWKLNAELLAGEQLDVRLSQTPWSEIKEESVMKMMEGKTSALLSYCALAGACIGEGKVPADSRFAEWMSDFARYCGLAFQMKDDLLGVFGDEAKFGKPIGSDIREGKRTVLMLKAMGGATAAERRRLESILGKADSIAEEIADARTIVARTGADKAVAEISDSFIDKALAIMERALPESDAKECLRHWTLSLVARAV